LAVIPNAAASSLHGFLHAKVQPGSRILSDGWRGYQRVQQQGFQHTATPLHGDPTGLIFIFQYFADIAGEGGVTNWLIFVPNMGRTVDFGWMFTIGKQSPKLLLLEVIGSHQALNMASSTSLPVGGRCTRINGQSCGRHGGVK